ncbi:MAG: TIGR01244 family sulfur transferase [Roseovarius sp.]|jgi:sulfide:quinone oxidoreductase|uniref:TIGR01244 family sulfur transferase n=1 Tax=Roseovarius sp. TaxID=1486281 RepID=UPI00262114C6|nr:TIGR01244 family sulfur transferase [Roseovarius sp.]
MGQTLLESLMDLRPITQDFTVSPQIEVEDVAAIAGAGYRSILCNRPDGEDYGQPAYDAVAAAAEAAGLAVRWVPIVSGQMTQAALDDFRAALDEMPKPILAYCRTGTRCTMLWSMTRFGDLGGDEILRATAEAGYDMSGLVAQLERRQ